MTQGQAGRGELTAGNVMPDPFQVANTLSECLQMFRGMSSPATYQTDRTVPSQRRQLMSASFRNYNWLSHTYQCQEESAQVAATRGKRVSAEGTRRGGRGECCSPVWPLAQQTPHWEAGAQHYFRGLLQQHPLQCGETPQAAAD